MTESLAMDALEVSFFGRAAHAAAAPWEGKSVLDAGRTEFTEALEYPLAKSS